MNVKVALLILPVVAVMAVSGCTELSGIPFIGGLFGPATVNYMNDVVIIKSLDATPSTVFPGQTVRLTAYVQNQGSKTLKGVKVLLYDYCAGGSFEPLTGSSGTDTGGSTGVGGSGGNINCGPGGSNDDEACVLTLQPYETHEIRWTLKAKDVALQTVCPPDGLKVLVNYEQQTTGLSTISLINYNEMQRQMSESTYKEKQSYIVAGEGPIKGYITVEDKQPVPVGGSNSNGNTGTGAGDDTTVIGFQLKNLGSGFLAFPLGTTGTKPTVAMGKVGSDGSLASAGIDMGDVGVIVANGDDDYCNKLITGGGDKNGIDMIQKESSKIVCQVNINSDTVTATSKELTKTMTFGIKYNYEFRASVKVTVKPKAVSTGGNTPTPDQTPQSQTVNEP